jgi:hypothetical protein
MAVDMKSFDAEERTSRIMEGFKKFKSSLLRDFISPQMMEISG